MNDFKVKKRNGEIVDFDINKITNVIAKAFESQSMHYNYDILEPLSIRVTSDFQCKIKNGVVDVEDIQDSVENTLANNGYFKVAKSYILYRKAHTNAREINYKSLVESYINATDWRVKENSTVPFSIGGMILNNSGAITANYWLSELYDEEIANCHRNADIHLHDLSMLSGYCAGWSLRQLIQDGLVGVQGKITSAPCRHLSTLCNQMVNFIGIMQNEWAGAQAFSSFDTYLAPFVKIDNLTYKETKQCIQSFIYGVNTPSRWGTQAPFSNITLDWTVPPDLAEIPAIVGGKDMDFCYKDCKKEMDMINKAFIEIMLEGDADGRGFQYPIPTYSISKDFDWSETENNKLLFEMTAKYGTPYFSNYVNSDMEPSDVRSMCPLTSDTELFVSLDGNTFIKKTIEEIYNDYINNNLIYKVQTQNGWINGVPNKQNKTKAYKIIFENSEFVKMGENHLQPTQINGAIMAKDLKVGMSVPFYNNTNCDYLKIVSIKEIDYAGDLYCLEVDNDDHLFVLANGLVTHNCRLRLDLRELRKKSGGFFGSGESTGSVGVVTINLPRLAYNAKSEQEFFDNLTHMMDVSARSLDIKRRVITKLLDDGLFPYTKTYLGSFDNHFSTIGIIGMNEAGLNASWLGKDLTHKETQEFAKKVLNYMRIKLSDYQEKYNGTLFNLEATPAESTTYRLAKKDVELFPDIITAGGEDATPYYTNSSHLPVSYTNDIFDALDIQDELQTLYTSGTVFHAFLGEKIYSWKSAALLVRKIAENYKLPYYTLSPTYSVCKEHGYITGECYTCPKCGAKTEVYSRITGYYRPVQNWNDGKVQEFKDRKVYDNKIAIEKYPKKDIIVSNSIHDSDNDKCIEEEKLKDIFTDIEDGYTLVSSMGCGKCVMIKNQLDNIGLNYTTLRTENNPNIVSTYNITTVPTLIKKSGTYNVKYSGANEIMDFLNKK